MGYIGLLLLLLDPLFFLFLSRYPPPFLSLRKEKERGEEQRPISGQDIINIAWEEEGEGRAADTPPSQYLQLREEAS